MSFLFPTFLFALISLAIPIIIHLFNLRRPKKVLFSNLELLKEVEQQTTKKLKVRSWLILLSRMLFLAFLVLVFSQPIIRSNDSVKRSPKPVYSIYIDNSLSMSLPYDAELTLFQGALKELDKLISVLPRNSKIQILNNSFGAGSMIFHGKEQARERLTEMNLSRQFRSKNEIYERQLNALKRHSETDKTVIWLSDFQKSFFTSQSKLEIDTNVQNYLIPISGIPTSNVFVDSVHLNSPFIRNGEIQTLEIWLKNSGSEDRSNIALKMQSKNEQISTQNVDLLAGETKKIDLSFVLKEAGLHQLELNINDNMVSFDNDFTFVLNVGEKIYVKEITDNATSPLAKIYGNEAVFNFNSYSSDNINYAALDGANLIILNEVKKMSNALKSKLTEFMKEGGSVVVIPDAKNTTLLDQLGITAQAKSDSNKARVVVPKMDNPFFKGVMAKYVEKANMPFARPVLNLRNSKTSVLKLNNGLDYLSQVESGNGTMFIFSSPFSEGYSNIYKHSLIVPLCYRLAMLTSESNLNISYRIGEENVKVKYVSTNKESVLSMHQKEQKFIPGQRRSSGYTLLSVPNEDLEKGFYQIMDQDTSISTMAFNYPKTESLIDFASLQEIQEEHPQIKVIKQEGEINFSDTFSEQNIGVALWKYCLILSLVFLAVEIFLIRLL